MYIHLNSMNLQALRRQSRFRVFGSIELVSTWLRLRGQGFGKLQAFKPASRINDAGLQVENPNRS